MKSYLLNRFLNTPCNSSLRKVSTGSRPTGDLTAVPSGLFRKQVDIVSSVRTVKRDVQKTDGTNGSDLPSKSKKVFGDGLGVFLRTNTSFSDVYSKFTGIRR